MEKTKVEIMEEMQRDHMKMVEKYKDRINATTFSFWMSCLTIETMYNLMVEPTTDKILHNLELAVETVCEQLEAQNDE